MALLINCLLPSVLASGPREPRTQKRSRRDSSRTLFVTLGDSLGHGTLDAINNFVNTENAFVQLVADRLAREKRLLFNQPFFDEQERRLRPFSIPTNLSVSGSDAFSLEGLEYYKRAGVDVSFLSDGFLSEHLLPWRLDDKYDRVLYPINALARQPVSQLDAGIWLMNVFAPAVAVDENLALLWIGNNDSSKAALGMGGTNPELQPLPLDQIAAELRPLLRLLLRFGERTGEVSFEHYAQWAIERSLTDLDDFAVQYDRILSRLLAETAASGLRRHIFVLTLPYYNAVGYLLDSDDLEFYLRKVNPDYTVPPTFERIAPPGEPITDPLRGDRVSLFTMGFMLALLDTGYPVDFVNQILEIDGLQVDGNVLTEDQQRQIRDRIDGYNVVIRLLASAHGPDVHLVDIGRFFNAVFTNEIDIVVAGRTLNRKWGRGGGFSLDGVHPNYTGHAVIANFVLEAIDDVLGTDTEPYDLDEIASSDPYIDRDEDGWVPGPSYTPTALGELLFLLTDPDDEDSDVGVELPDDVWDRFSEVLLRQVLEIESVRAEATRLSAKRRR